MQSGPRLHPSFKHDYNTVHKESQLILQHTTLLPRRYSPAAYEGVVRAAAAGEGNPHRTSRRSCEMRTVRRFQNHVHHLIMGFVPPHTQHTSLICGILSVILSSIRLRRPGFAFFHAEKHATLHHLQVLHSRQHNRTQR
jgi:hypothetical protein